MASIFIPVHTSCSTDGLVSGDRDLGVYFSTREGAETYLREHPNTSGSWGESEAVREVVGSTAMPPFSAPGLPPGRQRNATAPEG